MAVTLLFLLSILLNNFRNLVIFFMNVDIDQFLLLWNFFNILNRATIYIDHYLVEWGGVYLISSAYSLFSFLYVL